MAKNKPLIFPEDLRENLRTEYNNIWNFYLKYDRKADPTDIILSETDVDHTLNEVIRAGAFAIAKAYSSATDVHLYSGEASDQRRPLCRHTQANENADLTIASSAMTPADWIAIHALDQVLRAPKPEREMRVRHLDHESNYSLSDERQQQIQDFAELAKSLKASDAIIELFKQANSQAKKTSTYFYR